MSLIELLVAVSLMGIIVVGVVGLLGTMVIASDEAKTQAEAEALARSAAEDVKAWEYADCDASGAVASYPATSMLAPRAGTGLEAIEQADVLVEYGVPTADGIDWNPVNACRDAVAHRVSVTVEGSASNAKATGVVVKRRACLLAERVNWPVDPAGNCP
ncbi:MAG: hypothetical protein IT198_16725 [Acidimicrobiia bacterium]|nr:hypothetical protein [Acidimicrobiia bacterium]